MTSEAFAPAKVNLTLHVTGQRDDGYHTLDSLVAFAGVGDRLTFGPAARISLAVTGPFAAGVPTDAHNLVWQAAQAAGQTPAITLEKNLPHGGGIGGGSADAAALLRHYNAGTAALALGADVPVCLASRAQRMQGIGEQLTLVPALPPVWAVLVNPGVHVPTPDVFGGLHQKINAPMPDVLPVFPTAEALIRWLRDQRNDLEASARLRAPMIGDVLAALARHPQVGLVRMSGSGSTCFGLFAEKAGAEQAAKAIQAEQPHWWVQATDLS